MFSNMKFQGLWLSLDNEKMIKSQMVSIKIILFGIKKSNRNCPKLKQLKIKPYEYKRLTFLTVYFLTSEEIL